MKIVIVGAGIAGLAIGWRLTEQGAAVEILERGIVGRGATWAAAGMLAPGSELGKDLGASGWLARDGRERWPRFAAELEAASGRRIGYAETGSLIVAGTEDRARALRALAATPGANGAAWLDAAELRKKEPLLSSALHGALHIRQDAQVDNRALGEALRNALIRRNVIVREHCAVRSLVVAGRHVSRVVTSQGLISADAVILSCGAWTNLVAGIASEDLPPIRPAKGQMAALQPPEGTALPRFLIWAEDVYLVPRANRLFVGATVEDASFDTSVTREAYDVLIAAAAAIIPSLSGWSVAEMWAGLRPRTPDDAPALGATNLGGLYVAGGQFRNGILFAPAIAEAMCDLVLRHADDARLTAFDPRRFSSATQSEERRP